MTGDTGDYCIPQKDQAVKTPLLPPPQTHANTHKYIRTQQMTGGVGDYYIPEEEQPIGVRAARGFVSGIITKWDTTTNKFEVIL